MSLTLRDVTPEDAPFLLEVYAGTRAEELSFAGWDQAQLNVFLGMQLRARDQSYRLYYLALVDRIIFQGDERVGRLIISRNDTELRLVDIALLPKYRNMGLGTSLIMDLVREAKETNKTLRLQVEKSNPQALALYERMGFGVTGENQTHFQMEKPASSKQ